VKLRLIDKDGDRIKGGDEPGNSLNLRFDTDISILEVEMYIEMAKEIKTKESSRWNICRECMGANFNIFSFYAKDLNRRNCQKRDVFDSACCADSTLLYAFGRVESYSEEDFWRDHGKRCTGIKDQSDGMRASGTSEGCVDQDDLRCQVKREFRHKNRQPDLPANRSSRWSLNGLRAALRSYGLPADRGYEREGVLLEELMSLHPFGRQG